MFQTGLILSAGIRQIVILISGAGALHLPQSSRAGWSCIARNPPAGAVQTAQWRELDLSSSRAPAESPVVIRCSRHLSELRSSSVSGAVRVFQGTALQEVRVYRQAGEVSPPEIFHFTLFLKR